MAPQAVERLILVLASLAVLAVAILAGIARPLWYDELYTYYVALQPTPGATLRALLDGADNNPPVDYLLRQASMSALGASAGAFRLPSALAFVAGLLALYGYVRRHGSAVAAFVAFALPLGTLAMRFSYEGRGYALLFAAAAASLLAWQRATERPTRVPRLALLAGALTLGPFSHFYGVLNYLPVVAGEAWRSVQQRRIDRGVVAAIVASAASLPLLLPFAQNALRIKDRFWARDFNALTPVLYLEKLFGSAAGPAVLALVAACAVAVLLPGMASGSARPRTGVRPAPTLNVGDRSHELVAALVLAATPLSAYLLAELYTGALTPRYAIAAVAGVALLVGLAATRKSDQSGRLPGLVVAVFAGSALALQLLSWAWQRGQPPVPDGVRAMLASHADLPVAVDSPLTYLEYAHHLGPELGARLVYPMDAATAAAAYGENTPEISLRGLQRVKALDVRDYSDFVAATPRFYLLASRDRSRALAICLLKDGYRLELRAESSGLMLLLATPPDPASATGPPACRDGAVQTSDR
jgi:hypothetical protein